MGQKQIERERAILDALETEKEIEVKDEEDGAETRKKKQRKAAKELRDGEKASGRTYGVTKLPGDRDTA